MLCQNNLNQWLQDLFNTVDNKDTERFTGFLSDQIQFRFGNMPMTTGKTAVAEQVAYFFDSIKALEHRIIDFWIKDSDVMCHGTVTYTRHDDSTLTVPFANAFKINLLSIEEYLIFADLSELYQAE